ncbi:SusC/RagA family TonB-linked outer membrane protein [Pedobacter gandavensis]|uniref:SusC/RagA family TonB-linked outer membrane protein n=1 Tax=Pedobacter gandavensis TaxID=2679963 RepID=UPI00292E193A|nr:SusC/RagA family TonB-linked outer membrane protein [Pedobacter gandavensis]
MKKTFTNHLRFTKFFKYRAIVLAMAMVPASQMLSAAPVVKSLTILQETVTIKGIVKDHKDGMPMPGVTITDQDRKVLAATNGDGAFSVSVPKGTILSFNMIGYNVAKKAFSENQSNVVISLTESSSELNEVVVTALGIKREAKSLGFGATVVSGKEISDAPSNNWSDALKGKVPGMTLTQTGSGPINSARINLRGDRSLSGNNEALIVVDGVPILTRSASSGVSDAYGAGSSGADKDIPIDFGNGISDINPDDIASVTVLKGAAAAALYGSRAQNGALIITTKSGAKRENGLGITFNSNTSFNDVLRWPDYQYEYGQGNNNRNAAGELYYSYGASADGVSTSATSSAFGPKFNGQSYFQYDPNLEGQGLTRTPWVPYKDNIKGYWRTGYTLQNGVALDGGTDNFTARASITHTKNEWIMPNTGFERLVASLNTSMQISKKMKLNAKISYTNKTSDNLPGTGYNGQSIAYFMIFQNPNVDLDWYKPMWKKGLEQLKQIHPFSSYIENPYLIANEMTNSLNSNNLEGNLQGVYTFNDQWELMVRSGLNMRVDAREQRRTFDTSNFPLGYYKQQDVNFQEYNTDALLSYTKNLMPKLGFRASFGGNLMRRTLKENNSVVRGLLSPGVYKLSNALTNALAENELIRRETQSAFGLINMDWDKKIYLDITGRNDWSSTLPKGNNSYFYPSVSTSYILSEMFKMPKAISFAKLRLSWAQIGSDTEPYRTQKYYGSSLFPGSAEAPGILFNDNLKPEMSTSWETGANVSFFKNRITADLNLYASTTSNQVLLVPLDITTGYSKGFVNGGKVRNRGVEVMLSGKPVVSGDFSWTSTVTWSKNQNRILELSKDVLSAQQIIAQSGSGAASIIATVGGTTGDLWGYGLVRNDQGQVIFDKKTGFAVRPTDMKKIGNAYADWRGGFHNEFRYKDFTLSVLVDGQFGGIVYSQTHHKMTEQGKLTHTLAGREEGGVIGDGVIQNSDGSFSPNTTKVPVATWYADYYRRANVETNSFDASYLKLREARIEYRLPKTWIKRMNITGATIAFYGRDLAMISKFPAFDPETAALNGSTIMPGVEMGQLPSTRTFGLNLRLQL